MTMQHTRVVLGIDPGPTTGLCLIGWYLITSDGRPTGLWAHAIQCDEGFATTVVATIAQMFNQAVTYAIEDFVVGRGSMKSRQHGAITRDLIGAIKTTIRHYSRGWNVHMQAAGHVKPWATDNRLKAAGDIYDITHGMRHARDAARHALYAAVKHCGLPDPLSSKGGSE